ncbi:MAG: putative toxin-antitoxin system toxin component, PIN family [Actinomycetota bacterium]
MRILLDTNVLVSAIFLGGQPRELVRIAARGRVELVTSSHLLDELEAVLEEKFGFPRSAAREIRAEVEALSAIAEPLRVPKVCRDRDDDQVLAVAVAGRAQVIATGDRDLLNVGSHQGIEIQTPAAAISRIGSGSGDVPSPGKTER